MLTSSEMQELATELSTAGEELERMARSAAGHHLVVDAIYGAAAGVGEAEQAALVELADLEEAEAAEEAEE